MPLPPKILDNIENLIIMDTNQNKNNTKQYDVRSEPPCFCRFLKIKPISCVSMSNFKLTLSNLFMNKKT